MAQKIKLRSEMANRLDSSNVDTIIDNIIIHRKCNERNILRVIALLCITVCYFVIFQQQLPDVSIALTGEISTNHDLNSKESKKDDDASVPRTLHDQTGQRLHMRN